MLRMLVRPSWRRWTGIALVVVVALAGTGASWAAQRTDERRSAAHLMDRYTSDVSRAISTEIQRYGEMLTDVAVAVGAQPDLTATDFTWITNTVSNRRLPGATSFDLVTESTDSGVAGLQSSWRQRGARNLTLKPLASGGRHAFTVLRRSLDGRNRPSGTDLYAVPEAAEALRDSRSSGGFAVSRAYVLQSDRTLPVAQQQLSFRLAVPVYHTGNRFGGWLTMGVHGHDLLTAMLQAQTSGAVAADLSELNGTVVQTVAAASAGRAHDYSASLDRVARITIGAHTWTFEVYPTDALLRESRQGIVGTTFRVAMTITALLTLIVGLLASARNRAMAKVDAATAALRDDIERREQVETRLRERELELQRMVLQDPLTGLANRAGLDARLAECVGPNTDIALLLIDLDGFKLVNDVYGHAAGDAMLTEFARVLHASTRAGDVVARFGGDEFVVLLTDVPDEASAVTTAERILACAAATPVRMGEDAQTIRASIGVATGRVGDTPQELLRRADTAMYQAKHLGKHGVQVHHAAMTDRRTAQSPLVEGLTGVLERGELHVVYQPLVDLADGRPVGVEALLRWEHPRLGSIAPAEFIPVAERTGAIAEIGLFVLKTACRQVAQWGDLYVSVNLSPRQLQEPTLVHDVLDVLARTGLEPHRLVLEITESALVDESTGIAMLREFRECGIRVAIDDFGTGYSSLHYLTRLPVDILKIDRSFVAQLNGTPEGSGIAGAILRLSQVLHLTTIAEGVETASQAAELQLLGCGTGQGYLFARPMPAEELVELAETRATAAG
ncbi:putative bifunctional diguanylate cyclase/phosphodiesterase [Krasilnikovia sp. MM14-A1259]|uniref:putative bifunctional diguanylate cyclase/phosphodiesterase n=1 Tax=Krasilnikovia sp. MM14-A1259 TaxID=3373539 RepID=UPI00399C7C61